MEKFQLGEFEEQVMLTVGFLYNEAQVVAIQNEIERSLDKEGSTGALQAALQRLQKKAFLKSCEGVGTQERAGGRKRLYNIIAHGRNALEYVKTSRKEFWRVIPNVVWDPKKITLIA